MGDEKEKQTTKRCRGVDGGGHWFYSGFPGGQLLVGVCSVMVNGQFWVVLQVKSSLFQSRFPTLPMSHIQT